MLYFGKENPLKYKEYDLHVLKDSHETFDQIILYKLELTLIEDSVRKKQYLSKNMFIEVASTEKSSSIINEYQSSIDEIDQPPVQVSQIESYSPMNSNEDTDRPLLSMENIKDFSSDHLIDKLDSDDESIEKSDYPHSQLSIFLSISMKNTNSHFSYR